MKKTYERYLLELTGLPTAAGREGRVVAWVERWAKRHAETVRLRRDRYGNMMLMRKGGVRSDRPIVLGAHMDHPAFVVAEASAGREVKGQFRGWVRTSYFKGTAVHLHPADGAVYKGQIASVKEDEAGRNQQVIVRFDEAVTAAAGDVMTWAIGPSRVHGGRLHALACDDLAALAGAIAAFEEVVVRRKRGASDFRVLLTRAEEIGLLGAQAACRSRIMPRGSRIVALENSKSFADSPIGGGPIVRVGDLTSTFDPALTYGVGKVAEQLAKADDQFKWQRKLMVGGSCEASAYQAMGYTATCICLPLGNYHNMNEQTGKIDAEVISVADYHAMVQLLVGLGERLDDAERAEPLRARLAEVFEKRKGVLEEEV